MNNLFKKPLLLLLAVTFLLINCKKETDPEIVETNIDSQGRYKGNTLTLGNGKAYAWAKLSDDKSTPLSVGMTFEKGALENLSHDALTSLILYMPTEALGKTPFDHVYLTFSHTGHEPPGIYDIAHFDVHFYTVPVDAHINIPPYTADTAAPYDLLPAADEVPVPYFRLPTGVPTMGTHWGNPLAPELNGQKFVETFIMGSYNGKVTFYEPMITLSLLQSKPNISKDAPVAAKHAVPGYYPTKYTIIQEGDNVLVSLDGLKMMQ